MGAPSSPSTGSIQGAGTDLGQKQQLTNLGAFNTNAVNQGNVYGGVNYTQTGVGPNGMPTYTATTSLSPQQQALYNQFTGTQGQAGAAANALMAGANYGATSPTTAIGDMSSGLTGQMMDSWQKAQQPFFTTQQQQLDTQLRNQGVQPGNPAYDVAMRNLQTNQGYAVAGAASQFEPQAFGQATSLYQMPMQMGTQLAQFGAPTTPNASFVQTPQMQPADLAAALSAEIPAFMQPYSAAYQQYGNMMSGLFGLGGAGLKGLTSGAFGL
jgi:hypothetical protein